MTQVETCDHYLGALARRSGALLDPHARITQNRHPCARPGVFDDDSAGLRQDDRSLHFSDIRLHLLRWQNPAGIAHRHAGGHFVGVDNTAAFIVLQGQGVAGDRD